MDISFAGSVYVPRRMKELGFGDEYLLRVRPFQMQAQEKISIDAYGEYFILLSADEDITVSSKMGMYNPVDKLLTEQLEEHQGQIILENTSPDQIRQVKFLQVIPKNKKYNGQ